MTFIYSMNKSLMLYLKKICNLLYRTVWNFLIPIEVLLFRASDVVKMYKNQISCQSTFI